MEHKLVEAQAQLHDAQGAADNLSAQLHSTEAQLQETQTSLRAAAAQLWEACALITQGQHTHELLVAEKHACDAQRARAEDAEREATTQRTRADAAEVLVRQALDGGLKEHARATALAKQVQALTPTPNAKPGRKVHPPVLRYGDRVRLTYAGRAHVALPIYRATKV
jgi:chromosome segregation ATPase